MEDRTHAWVRGTGEPGWVWSGCGQIVTEGESTRNFREVTCRSNGCQQQAEEWRSNFQVIQSLAPAGVRR